MIKSREKLRNLYRLDLQVLLNFNNIINNKIGINSFLLRIYRLRLVLKLVLLKKFRNNN